MAQADLTARLSKSGQLLVRSGIEIGRLLGGMVEDGVTVSARLPSQKPFLSPLVCADPVGRFLRIRQSVREAANEAVFAAPSLILSCTHRGAQFAFSCARPREVAHGNAPAIELELPSTMLAVQDRRKPRPMPVPPQPQAYCRLWLGPVAFDAKVLDVGLDGSGILFAYEAMPVCAHTRFEARVFRAEREPLGVEVEVRRVVPGAPDKAGHRGTRLDCRFLAQPAVIEELIRLYFIDLK